MVGRRSLTQRERDADRGSSTAAKEGTRAPEKRECPGQRPGRSRWSSSARYSNRDDLLKPLVSILERIHEEPSAAVEEAQLTSADGPAPRAWQVSRRLSPTDIKALVTSYLAGSTIRALAEQYSISTTSVKRLLRERGARKQRPRRVA